MINHKIYKITLLLLIVVCTVLGLTGCEVKGNVIGLSDYHYDNSENYTAGEAELTETVKNIDISWMTGNVTVLTHNSNTVSFSEKSDKQLTEDMQLHYWLDNTTLRIKVCSCGKWDFSEFKKDLTVLVPETLMMSDLKVNTISANVTLSNCAVTQLVKVNTISGKLKAELTAPLNEFDGDSTSGEFMVTAPSVSRFDVDTINGAVSLSVQKEPDYLDVDTTSGNINLILPESASFTLDYDSTSGDMSSDLSYRRSSGKYVFGEGKGEYNIDTVSGDVRIMTIVQEENK